MRWRWAVLLMASCAVDVTTVPCTVATNCPADAVCVNGFCAPAGGGSAAGGNTSGGSAAGGSAAGGSSAGGSSAGGTPAGGPGGGLAGGVAGGAGGGGSAADAGITDAGLRDAGATDAGAPDAGGLPDGGCRLSSDCGPERDCVIPSCVTGQCTVFPAFANTVCRRAMGDCDVEDRCDGLSLDCPDRHRARGVSCGATPLACEEPSFCDGTAAACPPNPLKDAGVPCDSSDVCRPALVCSGTAGQCPMRPVPPPPACEPNRCNAGSCEPTGCRFTLLPAPTVSALWTGSVDGGVIRGTLAPWTATIVGQVSFCRFGCPWTLDLRPLAAPGVAVDGGLITARGTGLFSAPVFPVTGTLGFNATVAVGGGCNGQPLPTTITTLFQDDGGSAEPVQLLVSLSEANLEVCPSSGVSSIVRAEVFQRLRASLVDELQRATRQRLCGVPLDGGACSTGMPVDRWCGPGGAACFSANVFENPGVPTMGACIR